jgi:hypothetical protein
MSRSQHYQYVGPDAIRTAVASSAQGRPINSPADLADWLARAPVADRSEPFTFVVTIDGVLRLAPRRSEHVACAGGAPVLSAGEMTFGLDAGTWTVVEVSNQSTGYCPGIESWPTVAGACERAELRHLAASPLVPCSGTVSNASNSIWSRMGTTPAHSAPLPLRPTADTPAVGPAQAMPTAATPHPESHTMSRGSEIG